MTNLHRQPFKPFRIRVVNSTIYDVLAPWMLMVGKSSAIVATKTRKTERGYEIAVDWKTVSIHHMMGLADRSSPSTKSKRKS